LRVGPAPLQFEQQSPPLSTRSIRSNASTEIKRRIDMVQIFRKEGAIVRLVADMRLDQDDEWAAGRARDMTPDRLASISDNPQAKPRSISTARQATRADSEFRP
jgi:hypothetical protein